jgi:SAM-dependent methyltransferase
MGRNVGQDLSSLEKNKKFFSNNESYAQNVGRLETYQNVRNAIDRAISGTQRLLDVGNGGVFDYDTSLVPAIVGVDLFLDEAWADQLPSNVTLRRGDALALDESDASYDGVLSVFVFHHLVANDVAGTNENVVCAVDEARRVLEPGGRLIIVESCVSPRAFAVERRLFPMLRALASTRFMAHPATLQLPVATIESMLARRFETVSVTPIQVGRTILQFGCRWPTALTPARPFLFIAR